MSNRNRIEYQIAQMDKLVGKWKDEIPEPEINDRLTMVLRTMYMLDADTTFEFCDVKDKTVTTRILAAKELWFKREEIR